MVAHNHACTGYRIPANFSAHKKLHSMYLVRHMVRHVRGILGILFTEYRRQSVLEDM